MTPQRLLASTTCTLLLAATVASAFAQGRPAAANRRAEPAPNCLVSEFRAMALGTHDLAERTKMASDWFRRNAPGCSEDQLRLISSNRSSWMGNADSPQLMAMMDGALESRLKNRPELMAQIFGAPPPPPRPPGSDTVRAGDLAPRPAPVVQPGTPAVVGGAVPVVVPGAVPGATLPPGLPMVPGAPVMPGQPMVPGQPFTPGMPPGVLPPGALPPGLPPGARPPEVGRYFDERLRRAVREHFTANRGTGPCPPGVILKNGRCESPVSQRNWKLGEPLPEQLSTGDAPPQLLEKLGPAPAGHAYLLLEGDLLLVNTATRVVVDSVLDLGQVPPRS